VKITHSNISSLKVAICHEWFDNIGGGEKVLLELAGIFQNPTIYTLWANKKTQDRVNLKVKTSFLQLFPSKLRRNLGLLFMPLAWSRFNKELKSFDLVINSSWAFAHSAGGNHPRKISYIHTPGRYWWYPSIDQRTQRKIPVFLLWLLRRIDIYLSQNNNNYIANSEETRTRIQDCWGKESEVVYPPVDLEFFRQTSVIDVDSDLILGVGRFVGYKNHDFIIKIGEALGKKVVLAGHGPLAEYLKNLAIKSTTEVKVIDSPTNFKLRELYSKAFCLVYPTHEDFGIVPVEAMGCGLQVLGLGKGGLKETVNNGFSGTLVSELELSAFIKSFHELPNKPRAEIRGTVEKFDSNYFTQSMIRIIIDKLN
jgi:glycosyltransferase involved in cell wall biosynthesis